MAKLNKNIGEDPIVKPDSTNNKYLNIPGANKEKMATWLSMGKSEPESLRDAQLLAEAVGYSPEQALVVASQWAFESGGGAKLSSPYNYFGIKSHNKSVQERIKDKYGIEVGEGPQTKTAEFLGNGRVVIDDSFMTFNNAIESFLGHKAFLETNDIYSKALKAPTAKQFAQELQNAGYATVKNSEGKPIYASKLAEFYSPMQRNENYGKERSKYWGELKSEKLAEKFNPTPTLPKIENVPVPIERPPVDPSNFYLPETGPRAIEFVNTDAMNAMMKSKLAYANEFNNPAAQRMVAPTDQSYDFGNGETGTHFMSSYQNGGNIRNVPAGEYTYDSRPEAKYRKTQEGSWEINLPSLGKEFIPLKTNVSQRSKELERAALPTNPVEFQRNWMESYIQSPKFKERLGKEMPEKSSQDLDSEIAARLKNLQNADIHYKDKIGDTPGMISGLYHPNHHKEGTTYFDSKKDEYVPVETLVKENPVPYNERGDILLEREYDPNNWYPYSGFETTPLHEMWHGADDGGFRIPAKTETEIKKRTQYPDYRYPSYRNKANEEFDYYSTPTEFIGRMQPLRHLLWNENIYDAGNENFTEEHYKKMLNNLKIQQNVHVKDLLDSLKGETEKEKQENLIWLMNNIAKVDNDENANVAKYGGDIMSTMGYRDDSPFRDSKSLNIHSPNGMIDMSATGMPLMANGVYLPPYSGMHQVPTNNGIVTETPAVFQNGGGMNASAQVQPTIEQEPVVVPVDKEKQQKYLNTPGVNKEKLQQWFASGKEAPASIEDAQLLAEAVGYSPNHAKVVAGQWALESARGESVGGNYNYFGIKSHSAATRKRLAEKYGLTVSANDPVSTREEDKSGNSSETQSSFLNFEDPIGAFLGHKAFLETNKQYTDALKTETAYDFAATIKEAGYATGSEYVQSIGETIKPLIDEEEFKKFNKKELHSGHLNTLQTIPREQKSLVTRMPREMQFDVLDSLYKKETTDANEVQYEIDMATKKKNAYIDKLPVGNITPQKTPQFGQGQLFYAYGGPLGNPYQNGGNIGAGIASGAYGLAEGALDTLTFGLTDGLTDKGYEALFQNADKGVQGIRDVANIGGAAAGALINPAAAGSAIGEGAEGLQGVMNKTGDETISGIGNMVGKAGNMAGMFINPGEAATGKVASTLQQFSQNPLAQQGMGMINNFQNGGTTLPEVTVTGTKMSANPSGTVQATPAMIDNPNYAEQNRLYQKSLSNAPQASLSATADQAFIDNFIANRDKQFPNQAGLNINKLVYDPTLVDPNTGLPQQYLEYYDAPAKQVQAPTPATPAASRQASYLHPHTGQPLDPAIYGRPEEGSLDVQFSQGAELTSRKLENINARQATENEEQANMELLKTMTPEQIAKVKASGQTPMQYMNANAMTYGGGFMNAFAGGGNMFQNGGFGMNSMNEIPVTEFNAGGTHAENPLGGIPQGTGPNGQPNLVEEGELKIDDPRDPSGKAKFIVSAQDDMKITKELATEHDLPKKFVGKSVRKAADLLLRKGSRRDGDSIEENSKQQDLIGFINAHETLTQAKEAEKMSAFQDQMGALAQEYPSEMQRAFGGNIHQYNPNMYVDNPAFAQDPRMDYMQQSLTLPNNSSSVSSQENTKDVFGASNSKMGFPGVGITNPWAKQDPFNRSFWNTQGTASNTLEGSTGEKSGELEKYNPMQDVGNVQGQQGWGNYAMQMAPALMNLGQGLFGKKDSLNLSRMDEVKLGRINADQQLRELGYDAAQAQKRNKGLSGGGYRANAQSIFNAAQKARAGIHANVDRANTQIGNQEAGMNLRVGQINLGQEGKEQMYDKQAAAAKQALISTGVGQLAQMAGANQANDLAADYNSRFSDRYSYSYLRPWEKKTTK